MLEPQAEPITLLQVPVWQDNYAYVLRRGSGAGARAVVVDAPEAAPVLAALGGATLVAVLVTHHHDDHQGGAAELRAATGCRVFAPRADAARIPALTDAVAPGDMLELLALPWRVLDVRGHTRAHVAYALDAPVTEVIRHGHTGVATAVAALAHRPALFVGDALFAAGCGRLFEGDGADLHRALLVLAQQDARALVACAHEYTAQNLAFAQHAMPDSAAIAARAAGLAAERGVSGSSVPSVLHDELQSNPYFLALGAGDPVAAVTALRRQKDAF